MSIIFVMYYYSLQWSHLQTTNRQQDFIKNTKSSRCGAFLRLLTKSTALPTKRKTIVLVGTFRGQTTGTAKPNSRFSSLFYKNSHLFEPKSLTVPSAIKGCLLRETLRRNKILFCLQSVLINTFYWLIIIIKIFTAFAMI